MCCRLSLFFRLVVVVYTRVELMLPMGALFIELTKTARVCTCTIDMKGRTTNTC